MLDRFFRDSKQKTEVFWMPPSTVRSRADAKLTEDAVVACSSGQGSPKTQIGAL